MTIRTCRDCGKRTNEDPDDFAPALCAPCYDKRMARVQAELVRVVEYLDTPQEAIQWLATVLHEIGGETPAAAKQHASDLLLMIQMERG